jgi:hypothetical protein
MAIASTSVWTVGAYMDVAFLNSFNQPANRTWRSKSTSFQLDRLEGNMLTAYLRKDATAESRWGLQVGVQAGVDADGLPTSPPPPANDPFGSANTLRHLAATNLSYLFPLGNGLKLTAGLQSAYTGYESFHAIDNPNYTRGYVSDNVPYYLLALTADYPISQKVSGAFWLMTGFNYLTNPNDSPSYGAQVAWRPSETVSLTQNLYYGPDQENTAIEFWRFFSNSIIEWRPQPFRLALVYDFGTEKQAWLPGEPTFRWMAGALWLGMDFSQSWRAAIRPEFYWDPEGITTGARQTLKAVTTTLEYRAIPLGLTDISARLEYRYDRSTGDDGGFYAGADNRLVPDQSLLILALLWRFESGGIGE